MVSGYVEHSLDQWTLNGGVERRGGLQRGRYVHLEQPGFQILVEKYVEAEQLVATVTRCRVDPGQRSDVRLASDHRLHHYVLHGRPQFRNVHVLLLKIGPKRSQSPFVPRARINAIVARVGGVCLVDAVIGQMHETVAEVVYVVVVFDRGETDQAVRVEVDLQRVETRYKNVEAQIELGAAYQFRPGQVLLHYHGPFPRYLGPTVHHLDTRTPGGGGRFHDPFPLAAELFPNLTETGEIAGQNVGTWNEIELLHLVFQHHLAQIHPETILTSYLERARKMIDLLGLLHRPEARRLHVLAPGAAPLLAPLHQLKT